MKDAVKLTVRGRTISEDEHGHLCLEDIWEASGEKETRSPQKWRTTDGAKRLLNALLKRVTESSLKTKEYVPSVLYENRERENRGTFAHPILAAAYAGYLKPKLELEVREVWLRFRAGDASLADEILQKATAEANHWAGVRALSRSQRNAYTDVLQAHGVEDKGYMLCTERLYRHLLGAPSWALREKRGLPKKANLRNELSALELASVMAAEALATERISEEGRRGNDECAEATGRSAEFIRRAIDGDRKDRKKRLL